MLLYQEWKKNIVWISQKLNKLNVNNKEKGNDTALNSRAIISKSYGNNKVTGEDKFF